MGATIEHGMQMPAITENPWEGRGLSSKPTLGCGVTFGYGSDRYPGTIVQVSKTGHSLEVRDDTVLGTGGNFRAGNWTGTYHASEALPAVVWTRRRNRKQCDECGSVVRVEAEVCRRCCYSEQAWRPVYSRKGDTGRHTATLCIGFRNYHQDPHF